MTTDEIKQQVNMTELLGRYGVNVRGNMCRCPFHGQDKHPSMKVFKDGANCFTCGWNGDIFKFVQQMENCDFKTAFKILGGTYKQHNTKQSKALSDRRFQVKKDESERKEKERNKLKDELSYCIKVLNKVIEIYDCEDLENATDIWIDAISDKEIILYMWEEIIEGREVDINNAHRRCESIRSKYIAIR